MPKSPRAKRNDLATTIRRFRIALGDTQQQFAFRTGLSIASIGRYETNAHPSQEVLAKFTTIAYESNLPLFAHIFEKKLPLEEPLRVQEFAAIKVLLVDSTSVLSMEDLEKGRKALEVLMGDGAPPGFIDDVISRVVGRMARKVDLKTEIAYLKSLEVLKLPSASPFESWSEFLKVWAVNFRVMGEHSCKILRERYPEVAAEIIQFLKATLAYVDSLQATKVSGVGTAVNELVHRGELPSSYIDPADQPQ